MSWNPMMGPAGAMADPMQGLAQALSQYKPNQLGAGVTLGNPQAQEDYVAQLARALADSGAAGDLMDRANALKESGWIDNSGLAGVAERMFSGWASKKMSEKARAQQADAEERKMTAESVLEEAKAAREQARKIKEQQDKIAQVRAAMEGGDDATLAALGVSIPERKAPTYVDVPDGRGGTIKMESTADGLRPIRVASDAQNTPAANAGFKVFRDAIAGIESAGSGGYKAIGPQTKTGDRAYGRYQVMGANIPEWTKAALGRAMTPEEFAASPEAQDAVFDHRFGGYVQKYGPEGAAKAWFAGEGGMNNDGARDSLGTSVANYAGKFNRNMGGTQEQYADTGAGVIGGGLGYSPPKQEDDKPAEWRAKIDYLVQNGVPQQQAIQSVLGGKSQRITVNPETGEVSIEDGMPGGLTNASTTRTQADIQGAQDALAGLDRVGQAVKKDHLTYAGLAKGVAGRQMDRAGMSNSLTEFNANRGSALMEVEQFFNQYRKLITGAAAAEKELAALREATINGKLGPQEFMARYDRLVAGLRSDVERKQKQLGGGAAPAIKKGLNPDTGKAWTQGDVMKVIQDARAKIAQGFDKEAIKERMRAAGLVSAAERL